MSNGRRPTGTGSTPIGRRFTRDEAAMAARPLWENDEPLDLRALIPRRPWTFDAACLEHDPAIFFPARGERLDEAKAVCRSCLVRDECLEEALATSSCDDVGIWAGTSVAERKELRRRRDGLAA